MEQRERVRALTMPLNLEILDCPICYETLTIPIFQCDNGHLACSTCCPKLSNKCPSCASTIGHIRCRGMESVLESIFVPCRNAKLGCTNNVCYGKESTHEKECYFSPCSCPVHDCNYTGSYKDVFVHCRDTHLKMHFHEWFICGMGFYVRMNISHKIKIKLEYRKDLLFLLQCFREPYGVYVTVSCFAPSSPEVGEFSSHLSYTVDGYTMTYESPKLKRVLKVSFQTPREDFMLIPNCLLRGEELVMKLFVKKLNQE